MLLKQLKLNNIRSYLSETINFSEGSSLLSGDIGSGKSSILLAIEFALFGSSQPDLPAESLLRKGAVQGSVELSLDLNNKEIVIKRNLKKEKNNLKQTAGYLVINNVKKELMPVELKAEIINLLGYPEEFISKNKNYIFRYTVYTPQEEMKFILLENNEVRLDVLRKIFNIDKYKIIRENLQLIFKKYRTEIAILKTKTELFHEQKEKFSRLIKEKEELNQEIEIVSPKLKRELEKFQENNQNLLLLEDEQKKYLELKQKLVTSLVLLKEKQDQNFFLRKKEKEWNEEISRLLVTENYNSEQLKEKLRSIEEQKSLILTKKTTLEEKIIQIQETIKRLQPEIEQLFLEISRINEKEELKLNLVQGVSEKETFQIKKKTLEDTFRDFSQQIVRNQTILSQSKKLQEKIQGLNNCPTCLQIVSDNHKHEITTTENKKINEAEIILTELGEKKNLVLNEKEQVEKKIGELILKENLLVKIDLELNQLREKEVSVKLKEEEFKMVVKNNNQLMKELSEINRENNVKELNQKTNEIQELINKFLKKELMEKTVSDLVQQIEENKLQELWLQNSIVKINQKLSLKEDLNPKIESRKKEISSIRDEEKRLSIKLAQLKIKMDHVNSLEKETREVINKLNKEKKELIRIKEVYHWLESHLFKLTYAIERQVMVNIHGHFNQLFQEWFSILIDDENIYAKIDDSFTPLIEQNGYEISFCNLSGGEKTSAALAYRLALNRVINDVINQINTKDLLILDEPTDGFSTEQLDKVRDVLDKLNLRQTIIVSHESKIESFVDSITRISKERHISSVS